MSLTHVVKLSCAKYLCLHTTYIQLTIDTALQLWKIDMEYSTASVRNWRPVAAGRGSHPAAPPPCPAAAPPPRP